MLGARIVVDSTGQLVVPNEPIVPVVSAVGWAAEATRTARRHIDEAVVRAYGSRRKIRWLELSAGEASMRTLRTPVPDATVEAIRVHRVAFAGALPAVQGDARTLESELTDILDLHLGFSRVGVGDTTLLCWENRETSAANLGLEEGGSDSARVSSVLAATRGDAASERAAPGWALSVASRHAAVRFEAAAIECANRHGAVSNVAVLEGPTGADAAFARWVIEASTDSPKLLSVSSALTALLEKRPLPDILLAGATMAAHLLRLAGATGQGALAAGLSHPETGHCVIGPLKNDVSEQQVERAMMDAGQLLLRHLGWPEAVEVFGNTEVAQAS